MVENSSHNDAEQHCAIIKFFAGVWGQFLIRKSPQRFLNLLLLPATCTQTEDNLNRKRTKLAPMGVWGRFLQEEPPKKASPESDRTFEN